MPSAIVQIDHQLNDEQPEELSEKDISESKAQLAKELFGYEEEPDQASSSTDNGANDIHIPNLVDSQTLNALFPSAVSSQIQTQPQCAPGTVTRRMTLAADVRATQVQNEPLIDDDDTEASYVSESDKEARITQMTKGKIARKANGVLSAIPSSYIGPAKVQVAASSPPPQSNVKSGNASHVESHLSKKPPPVPMSSRPFQWTQTQPPSQTLPVLPISSSQREVERERSVMLFDSDIGRTAQEDTSRTNDPPGQTTCPIIEQNQDQASTTTKSGNPSITSVNTDRGQIHSIRSLANTKTKDATGPPKPTLMSESDLFSTQDREMFYDLKGRFGTQTTLVVKSPFFPPNFQSGAAGAAEDALMDGSTVIEKKVFISCLILPY